VGEGNQREKQMRGGRASSGPREEREGLALFFGFGFLLSFG